MAMVVVMVIHGLEGGMIWGGVQFWAVGLTENIASPKQIPGTDFVAAQNGWGSGGAASHRDVCVSVVGRVFGRVLWAVGQGVFLGGVPGGCS